LLCTTDVVIIIIIIIIINFNVTSDKTQMKLQYNVYYNTIYNYNIITIYTCAVQLFEGNVDSHSIKASYLDSSVIARFIKFHTVEWSNHPSLRVEIIGCQGTTFMQWRILDFVKVGEVGVASTEVARFEARRRCWMKYGRGCPPPTGEGSEQVLCPSPIFLMFGSKWASFCSKLFSCAQAKGWCIANSLS